MTGRFLISDSFRHVSRETYRFMQEVLEICSVHKGEKQMSSQKIDCFKCKYFYVTWDRNHPKGCRAFQFKTRQMPSLEVFLASGHPCLRFEKKT